MKSIADYANIMKEYRSLFYNHAQYPHMAETVIRVVHCGERGGSDQEWDEQRPILCQPSLVLTLSGS